MIAFPGKKLNRSHLGRSDEGQAYLMLLPQIIGFLLFSVYPICWIFRYAWFDYDSVTEKFIGADNFIRIFTRDPDFWNALANTFILSIGKLLVELPLALVLAVLLNNPKMKTRGFFRSMFFMPNVVSVAIVGLIFYFLFDPFQGIVNNIILALNPAAPNIQWFSGKWEAMLVIAVASIWQNFGVNMLFFLSGLQNIPEELYECSQIDGASKFQQFTRITLPMLAPTMQIIIMLALIGSLKVTDLVLVLTNGNPAGQTEVAMTYIFKYFFKYGEGSTIPQIGYASALGMVMAVILAIVSGIYLKLTKNMNDVG